MQEKLNYYQDKLNYYQDTIPNIARYKVNLKNKLYIPQYAQKELYSGTSLKGLSELKTQYKKPPY